MGVFVKNAHTTCAAAGTLPGSRGKECTPPDHTASARLVPCAHPDHVVRVICPGCVTALFAGHFSNAEQVLSYDLITASLAGGVVEGNAGRLRVQDEEITRDQFTSYVTAADAEVVYPLAYRESWNAIGCCSWAAKAAVNDVGFITSLVSRVDPGHTRPVYVVGYSNGGRLA